MSKLVEYARKHNLIRDVSYADIVDDSDWSGLIKEEQKSYANYHEKDIVFVKNFSYQNGKVGTNHLFVIMEEGYWIPIEYFCYLISSKINKVGYPKNFYLPKDENNHLNKNSIVKTDIIYEMPKDSIICKIGTISDPQYQRYKKEFLKIYA